MTQQLDSVALLQAIDTKIGILDLYVNNPLALAKSIGLVEAKILIHAQELDAKSTGKCFDDIKERVAKYQAMVAGE